MNTRRCIYFLLSCWLCCGSAATFTACSDDDDNNTAPPKEVDIITLNVDVILPTNIQTQWQNAIDLAQTNIAKAQQKLGRQVKLNLRYHDEDAEDLSALGLRLTSLTGADTCHAIIGPYHSSNAQDILKWVKETRLPVVLPTCSSSELQRIYAKSTYAWFLTESDITQCEMMISAAKAIGASDVALIYSDDTYGRSFLDWFAFYAAEQEVNTDVEAITAYRRGDDLSSFLDAAAAQATGLRMLVCVALGDGSDYLSVGQALTAYNTKTASDPEAPHLLPIFADTSSDNSVLAAWPANVDFGLGISPVGAPAYGFPQYATAFHDQYSMNGEAQVYDALCIIAMGAALQQASPNVCLVDGQQVVYKEKPYTVGLTDYMRSVVSNEGGVITQWNDASLATAFSELSAGRNIDISGATGSLLFDQDTRTKILNTTYLVWQLGNVYDDDGHVMSVDMQPVIYLSTVGTNSEASTTSLWQQQKRWQQMMDDVTYEADLPNVTDHWAVVISPSTTWSNYRHQADAFAMYQLLRHHGYDDDHIILIVEDNLANSTDNKDFAGQIFVERGDAADDNFLNDDVRKNAVVDYHFSDLQPDDIGDILMGRASARLPHVVRSTATSNVFFFWSGHGGSREGPLWGNENASTYFGTDRICRIVDEMAHAQRYRRMMLAIETCYSGQWGESLTRTPDVLVFTAANPNETSKADVHDKQLGVYLSNAFARTFRRDIDQNPAVTIYDLYKDLARTTTGSHVMLYNQLFYGSVYTETMSDYFPE